MSYRTAAGTALLFFVSLNFAIILLANVGIEFPRHLWWLWVSIIASADISWIALAAALCLEEPARR